LFGREATLLSWASFALAVAATVVTWFMHNRRAERRVYWGGWLVGSVGVAVTVSGRDGWRGGLIAFSGIGVCAIVMAIRYTPYLKIGDRIIATSRFDRRPDTPEGDHSPPNTHSTRRHLTAEDVRSQTFAKPVGRQGYNPDEVYEFLERIAQRLDGRQGLTAEDVQAVRFSRPRPFVRGYDPDQVDEFIDEAAATVAGWDLRYRPTSRAWSIHSTADRSPHTGDTASRDVYGNTIFGDQRCSQSQRDPAQSVSHHSRFSLPSTRFSQWLAGTFTLAGLTRILSGHLIFRRAAEHVSPHPCGAADSTGPPPRHASEPSRGLQTQGPEDRALQVVDDRLVAIICNEASRSGSSSSSDSLFHM
jgi:DivIVA domain-containing protein